MARVSGIGDQMGIENETEKWSMHKSESVLEKETHKITRQIHMDPLVYARKLVLIKKYKEFI